MWVSEWVRGSFEGQKEKTTCVSTSSGEFVRVWVQLTLATFTCTYYPYYNSVFMAQFSDTDRIVEHQLQDKGVVNIPGVNRWGRIRTKPKTSSNINLGWLSTVCQICQVINKTFGWSLRSLLSVSVEQAGTPNVLAAGAKQFRAELIEINAKNRSNHPYPRGSMGYWD